MEVWANIRGYGSDYSVSSLGNIRSNARLSIAGRRLSTKLLSTKGVRCGGYPVVGLSKNGKPKTLAVHILVAKAFIPNPNKLPQVNHIDGNPLNAAVDNLEWTDNHGNQIHACTVGLKRVGQDSPLAKLSNDDVAKIRELYAANKYNQYQLAAMFNVNQNHISNIVNFKRRKFL